MGVLAALLPAALVLLGSATAGWAQQRAHSGLLPANVDAVYRIKFTALGEIGHFHFNSTINGDGYTLAADARVKTTIFKYDAGMSSKGVLVAGKPQPGDHAFNYRQKALLKKKKIRVLNMGFKGAAVSAVKFEPPDDLSASAIPVKPEHLKGVLYPLSGVMALSLVNAANPCTQKLPIYDGKQRLDVVFTPLRRAGADHVCSVRLVPIAGHKPGEGAASVIKGNIELVLRPVPQANVVIPYSVTVPTIVGTAVLVSERVDITMPDQQRIALRR
jgi:hypothetical protein